jgi:Uma2 family endonuclease
MFEDTYGNLAQPPLQLTKKEKFVTLKQYVLWEAKKTDKYEYHHGKIIKMPNARGPHNKISANIITALNIVIWQKSLKFQVFSSDQKIYLPEVDHGVYPDSVAVSIKPEYWDDDNLLLVNPLLVVEVLSKTTQKYDREGKFHLYKTRPTFQEYVLVRQDTCEVEVRHKEGPGLWLETIQTNMAETIYLKSLGFSIEIKDIYRDIEFPAAKVKKK